MILVILAKAYVQLGGLDWWPFLIQTGEETVGIVAVADNRQPPGELVVSHLLIDEHHQRRGYSRAALRELIELGRRTDRCDLLRLTVHPQNAAAIALYLSVGFREAGIDADGELCMSTPV